MLSITDSWHIPYIIFTLPSFFHSNVLTVMLNYPYNDGNTNPTQKESKMAYGRGHCQGIKKEQQGKGTPWYAAIQEEALRKVEAAWQAKQAQHAQEK